MVQLDEMTGLNLLSQNHNFQTHFQPSLLLPADEPELLQRALDQRLPHGGGQERSTSSGQTDGEHVLNLTA